MFRVCNSTTGYGPHGDALILAPICQQRAALHVNPISCSLRLHFDSFRIRDGWAITLTSSFAAVATSYTGQVASPVSVGHTL